MKPDSLRASTARGLAWMAAGSGVQAFAQLLVVAVLARLVTPEEFGVVGLALLVVAFGTLLPQVGVGQALVQCADLDETHVRTGLTMALTIGLVGAGLALALARPIAGFFRVEAWAGLLGVMGLLLPVAAAGTVSEALLQRAMRFRALALVNVAAYGLGFGIVGVVLALRGLGPWALVGGHFAQALLRTVLAYALVRHPARPLFDPVAARALTRFGLGISIAGVNNQVARKADAFVVGRWLGADALGLYERAYQFVVMPLALLGQVMDRVLFAAMAQRQERPDVLARAFRQGVHAVALASLPVAALMAVVSPELVAVLLGPDWSQAAGPFAVLAAGILFRTGAKVSDAVTRATGAVYRRAWRQGVYAATVFLGAMLGARGGLV
ncbi:MAG: lipopolysaccharide biosynthesis protein, partial [Gemmatimonadetes bacterium]